MTLVDAGHLYVVGHHVASLGHHGPPDPDRLLTPERLRDALPTELTVEVLATRYRPGDHGQGHQATTADTVVVAWVTKPLSLGGQQ